MVLYRKYRPQRLSELDLVLVREKLTKTLVSTYKPHAYLFAGPKGTGKTSAARIVAKILNCEEHLASRKLAPSKKENKLDPKRYRLNADIEPCNRCENCISITEGRNLDIIEIDAASNRGIEEIRDLREKIKLVPVSVKYKVYIIDEVHMLTNEAFNALLKTLEEPPRHAVFILATTEVEKLPETIQSRCLKFIFHKATDSEVVHALKRVVSGEKLKVDDEVLLLIAQSAEGSFRDATKLLEQAISEKELSVGGVSSLLGKDGVSPEKFLILLKNKSTKELLEKIILMGKNGQDFRFFVISILNLLHALFLDIYQIEQPQLSTALTKLFSKDEVNNLIKVFSHVYSDLRFASRPELPLETAVVDWCEKA